MAGSTGNSDVTSARSVRAPRSRTPRSRGSRALLLPQLLVAAVELGPGREALRFEGRSLSYAE
ncbi:hypothetical protein, partial [Rhodococcus sp. NPDC055024]